MKSTTAQRFGSLGKSFVSPSAAAAVIGAALLASGTTDEAETAWSPAAACLLPDVLPVAGTLLSYGGSRQLAAGGTVTHSGTIEVSKSGGKSIQAISNATEVFGVGPAYISGSYYDRTHITTNRFSYWSFSSAGSSLIFGEDPTLPAVGAASISGAASGGFGLGSGAELSWYNNSSISSGTVDAKFSRSGTAIVDLRADNGFRVRNFADSADAALTCGAITASSTITASTNVVVGPASSGFSSYLHKGINTYGLALGFSNTGTPHTAFNFEFGNVRFQMVGANASLNAGSVVGAPDVSFMRNSTGPKWSLRADGGLEIRNIAGSADAPLTCGAITASGTVTIGSMTLTGGSPSQVSSTNRLTFGSGAAYIFYQGANSFSMNADGGGAVTFGGAITASGAIQETPTQSSLNPTTTDIPSGKRMGWYNSTLSEFRDWVNIGGTLLKSAAYT